MQRDIAHSPPWTVEDNSAGFIVRDHNGIALAYVYYEREPQKSFVSANPLAS
jgi:hypothetical protein